MVLAIVKVVLHDVATVAAAAVLFITMGLVVAVDGYVSKSLFGDSYMGVLCLFVLVVIELMVIVGLIRSVEECHKLRMLQEAGETYGSP